MMTSHQSASTLEEIERRHVTGFSNTSDGKAVNDFKRESAGSSHHIFTCGDPESPNTVLRRTLNIAPLPSKPDTGQLQRKSAHHSPSVTGDFAGGHPLQPSVASIGIPLFRTEAAERVTDVGGPLMDCVVQRSTKERASMARSQSPDCLITPQALVQGLAAKVMCVCFMCHK